MSTYDYKAACAARTINKSNGADKPTVEHFYPAKLPAEQRKVFVAGLNSLKPELAELLKNDPFIKDLRDDLDATVCFEKQTAREIYRAGLRVLADAGDAS